VNPAVVIIAVAAALALILLALYAVARVRRRRQLARPSRPWPGLVAPRHPIVLAHGILGFDEIGILGERHDYFRGVATRLKEAGVTVHSPRVPGLASVAVRAEHLASYIRGLPEARVNIIAHSMGGLDARYAIRHLGLAGRVASLVTIGTPHRGTPIADLGNNFLTSALAKVLGAAGVDVAALREIQTQFMERFNESVDNDEHVFYASVIAVAPRAKNGLNPMLRAGHAYLRKHAGPNDGLVPASSQRWGAVLDEIDADHWAQIGWSKHFDARRFYAHLLGELHKRGL